MPTSAKIFCVFGPRWRWRHFCPKLEFWAEIFLDNPLMKKMALEVWDSILLPKNDEKQQEECNINNIYFFLNIYNWTKLFNFELFKRHLSIFLLKQLILKVILNIFLTSLRFFTFEFLGFWRIFLDRNGLSYIYNQFFPEGIVQKKISAQNFNFEQKWRQRHLGPNTQKIFGDVGMFRNHQRS